MANSIQPLQGSIPFPPSAQMALEDSAAALAFGDAVAAIPAIQRAADTAAKVVNTATLEQPVAAVIASEIPVPEPQPTDVIMPLLHTPQILVGPSAMSAVIPPNDMSVANVQSGTPDPDAGQDSSDVPAPPAAMPDGIAFQVYVPQPIVGERPLLSAVPATKARAEPTVSIAPETAPLAPLAAARNTSDRVVFGPNPPLQFIAALATPTAIDPPQSGNLPDITPSMPQQERAPNDSAKEPRAAAPLPKTLTPFAETPLPAWQTQARPIAGHAAVPFAHMNAPGPVDRGPMAALFASVPQLAPRMIQLPVAAKGSLAETDVQPKAPVLPALAAMIATPAHTQPAPALPATAPEESPTPDPAPLTARPETDHPDLFSVEPGLAPLSDGPATLSAPTAAGVSDRGLPTSTQPVPVADLPQIVARLASSENTQTLGLRLDPVELGTVAFNMDTGAAGLVVTITAERPETLDLLRRHADQFLADLRQSGFQGASLQFSQSGNGQTGQGQPGQGQFGQGNGGNPQPQSHTNPDYGTSTQLFEKQPSAARPTLAGTLNLRL